MLLLIILAVLIIPETNGESVASSPLVFLDIESRSTAERLRPCDDCAELVNLPTDIKIGNFTFNKTYVSSNGLFSFGQQLNDPFPLLFPAPLPGVNAIVAPFWDDIDLRLPTNGTLVYELVTKGNATNIINDVNTFISNHQMIQFNADWVLIAKWIDVCPYEDRSCTNTQPNTYQAIIATQLELSYAVFTYKCDLLRWTLHAASVGFSAGPYFYSNHPLSKIANVTNIDCINYPNSPWYNVVYNLNENGYYCEPDCVHGNCTGPNTCQCNTGWNGTICDTYYCEPDCVHGNCTGPNTCRCNTGWNGTICVTDINECVNSSICHHYCNNTQGSYHCYCQDGFMLSDDNYTCTEIKQQENKYTATISISFGTLVMLMMIILITI